MKMVTVPRMGQTVDFKGKKYGPSADPINIPEDLANSLGLAGTPVGAGVAPTDADPGEVASLTEERDQLRGNLASLTELLKPHQLEGEYPNQVLERLIRERTEAQGQTDIVKRLRETDKVEFQVKLDESTQALASAKSEWEAQRAALLEDTAKALEGQQQAEDALTEYRDVVGELLPADFPSRKVLLEHGYYTAGAVAVASDKELIDLPNVGDKTLEAIRKVAPHAPPAESE